MLVIILKDLYIAENKNTKQKKKISQLYYEKVMYSAFPQNDIGCPVKLLMKAI